MSIGFDEDLFIDMVSKKYYNHLQASFIGINFICYMMKNALIIFFDKLTYAGNLSTL